MLLLVAAAAAAPAVVAQSEAPPVPLATAGGQLHYTLGESRDDVLLALRLASPLAPLGTRHWLLEPGLSYGWYRADAGQRRHVVGLAGEVRLRRLALFRGWTRELTAGLYASIR